MPRTCGSPIYSRRVDDDASVRVRFGTLDGDPGARAVAHVCIESMAPWFELTDELPRFDSDRRYMTKISRICCLSADRDRALLHGEFESTGGSV